VALGVSLLFGLTQPLMAEEERMCPVCAKANQDQADYSTKAGHTLARGAANTLLGWTDLIREPAQEVRRGGNVFRGLALGVSRSATRTLGGAAEVLTFWTPKVQGRYLHFARDCPVCAGKTTSNRDVSPVGKATEETEKRPVR